MMMAGERGVLGQTKNGVCDEIVKPRAGQWECSHMIRPLVLGSPRLAQDLGTGQGFLEIGA